MLQFKITKKNREILSSLIVGQNSGQMCYFRSEKMEKFKYPSSQNLVPIFKISIIFCRRIPSYENNVESIRNFDRLKFS